MVTFKGGVCGDGPANLAARGKRRPGVLALALGLSVNNARAVIEAPRLVSVASVHPDLPSGVFPHIPPGLAPGSRASRAGPSTRGLNGPSASKLPALASTGVAGAEFTQAGVGPDPRVVAIGPSEHQRVIPDTFDSRDGLVHKVEVSRCGRMALTTGARAPAPQVVESELGFVSIRPVDRENPSAAKVTNFDGLDRGHAQGLVPRPVKAGPSRSRRI